MSFKTLPANFDPAMPGPQALIAVLVPWCGYCQQFKPQLKAMEKSLTAKVYVVDGDKDPRVKNWKVDGFPTILYHASAGGLYKYNGQRTMQGIQRFIDALES